MLIQFTTSVSGANFDYEFDEKVELREDIALGFVKAGQAVPVRDEREMAVAGPSETAVSQPRVRGIRKRTLRNLGGLLQG